MAELSVYDNDPTLYLFTSLTAGSSHIVTATSRIETILRANKIPFKGVDTATDDLARKLFQRRASGKKLPFLVKEGYVLGDLEQIEEWNEYDELKEALGVSSTPLPAKPAPPTTTAPSITPVSKPEPKKENTAQATSEQNLAIRQLGAEAAKVAAAKKSAPSNINTTNPLLMEKVNTPTASTPKKVELSPGGLMSPKSIPLPATPGVASPGGIMSPRSIPLPATPGLASSSLGSSGERKTVSEEEAEGASEEVVKSAEKESAISEESEEEKEDSEEASSEDSEEEAKGSKSGEPAASLPTGTEKEGAKHEDEDEEKDEDEDEDDESEDEDTTAVAPKDDKPSGTAGVKTESNEESEEEEEEEDDDDEDDEVEDKDTTRATPKDDVASAVSKTGKPVDTPITKSEKAAESDGETDESEDEEEQPQKQNAASPEKAGVSVKD